MTAADRTVPALPADVVAETAAEVRALLRMLREAAAGPQALTAGRPVVVDGAGRAEAARWLGTHDGRTLQVTAGAIADADPPALTAREVARLREQVRSGEVISLPGGMQVEMVPPAQELLPFLDRLAFLLGLSDAERAFVRAARHPGVAADAEGAADAITNLLVFADWLDEEGRDGGLFRRLVPAAGDVLVFRVPKAARGAALRKAWHAAEQVRDHLRAAGRPCLVYVLPNAQRLEHLDPVEMRKHGWIRNWEGGTGFTFDLLSTLEGEPEHDRRAALHASDALLAMIGRLKRENAELRQENRRLRDDVPPPTPRAPTLRKGPGQ